jgi:hypothetical protein
MDKLLFQLVKQGLFCEVWGSHSNVAEDLGPLKCDTISTDEWLLTPVVS